MKNIKNLNELVSYYNNKADWTPAEVKDFVKIKNDFYDKDWETFDDEIAGFDDEGYGEWTLESRTCDGWAGLDDLIEKFCGESDLDVIASEDEYNFLYPVDDEQLCFSLEKFRDYLEGHDCKLLGEYCCGNWEIMFDDDYIDFLENKINKKLENENTTIIEDKKIFFTFIKKEDINKANFASAQFEEVQLFNDNGQLEDYFFIAHEEVQNVEDTKMKKTFYR